MARVGRGGRHHPGRYHLGRHCRAPLVHTRLRGATSGGRCGRPGPRRPCTHVVTRTWPVRWTPSWLPWPPPASCRHCSSPEGSALSSGGPVGSGLPCARRWRQDESAGWGLTAWPRRRWAGCRREGAAGGSKGVGPGACRAALAAPGAPWRSGRSGAAHRPLGRSRTLAFPARLSARFGAPAARAVLHFATSARLSARFGAFGATWRSRRDRCRISTRIAPRLDC
jgi:hypothetical protein